MSLDEEICVLCCQEIKFYATGSCDHPVCFECSTRMRVLCEQNECPICRNDMPLVIFTHQKRLFSEAPRCKFRNERYSIAFEDDEIHSAFRELLDHVCPICGGSYESFEDLKTHVRSVHTLFYCDLCAKNLKIFSFERRCYNRKDFAYHKRKGDPDNTSHRGHPLCEFCDERFLDYDELYRHLRREHYFCHFCDADGMKKTQFFPDYSFLRIHFLKEHYLCEEGDCVKEQFVSAFRTEIDFKAHVALTHSKNKSKAEAKQARTLDLQFPITRRKPASGSSSPNYNDYRQKRHNVRREQEDSSNETAEESSQNSKQSQVKKFNTQCEQDFPHLANGSVSKHDEHFRESSMYANCVSSDNHIMRRPARPIASRKYIQIDEFPSLNSVVNQQKNKNKGPRNIAAAKPSSASVNSSSAQPAPIGSQTNVKWGKSGKENNDEKNANEGVVHRNLSKQFTLEEFPKLKIKEVFQANARTQPPQNSWHKPEAPPPQPKDVIAQQIYQKCKSKKTQKNSASNIKTIDPNQRTEPTPLNKIYSGFTNYNVMDDDEAEDAASRNLKLKMIDKVEKHRRKIEEEEHIPWREEAKLVEEDFPPLGPPPASVRTKRPPGFNNVLSAPHAPPGFSKKPNKPVPNSTVSLSSIAQQLADEKEPVFSFTYSPPSDFQKRNGMLIQQIYEFVDSDNKLFDQFKSLSGNFRKSRIPAVEYYSSCMELLGKVRFLQLFPELLCLLPDIKKQQELLAVHNSLQGELVVHGEEFINKGAMPKSKGTKIDSVSPFSICQTCNQVLVKKDFDAHINLHKVHAFE